jgi:putative hemolysin
VSRNLSEDHHLRQMRSGLNVRAFCRKVRFHNHPLPSPELRRALTSLSSFSLAPRCGGEGTAVVVCSSVGCPPRAPVGWVLPSARWKSRQLMRGSCTKACRKAGGQLRGFRRRVGESRRNYVSSRSWPICIRNDGSKEMQRTKASSQTQYSCKLPLAIV